MRTRAKGARAAPPSVASSSSPRAELAPHYGPLGHGRYFRPPPHSRAASSCRRSATSRPTRMSGSSLNAPTTAPRCGRRRSSQGWSQRKIPNGRAAARLQQRMRQHIVRISFCPRTTPPPICHVRGRDSDHRSEGGQHKAVLAVGKVQLHDGPFLFCFFSTQKKQDLFGACRCVLHSISAEPHEPPPAAVHPQVPSPSRRASLCSREAAAPA